LVQKLQVWQNNHDNQPWEGDLVDLHESRADEDNDHQGHGWKEIYDHYVQNRWMDSQDED